MYKTETLKIKQISTNRSSTFKESLAHSSCLVNRHFFLPGGQKPQGMELQPWNYSDIKA